MLYIFYSFGNQSKTKNYLFLSIKSIHYPDSPTFALLWILTKYPQFFSRETSTQTALRRHRSFRQSLKRQRRLNVSWVVVFVDSSFERRNTFEITCATIIRMFLTQQVCLLQKYWMLKMVAVWSIKKASSKISYI